MISFPFSTKCTQPMFYDVQQLLASERFTLTYMLLFCFMSWPLLCVLISWDYAYIISFDLSLHIVIREGMLGE